MSEDYFMQYGLDKSMPVNQEKSTVTTITLKKIDKNKISVTDVRGMRDDVPTFQYVANLEKQIERLEELNRTLRSQNSHLNNRLNQVVQAVADLTKKSFNSYEN